MASHLAHITWTTDDGIPVGNTTYLDVGNTVTITYSFNGTPHPTLHSGDYIVLSNGAHAVWSPGATNTGVFHFVYQVGVHDQPGRIGVPDTTIHISGGAAETGIDYNGLTSSGPTGINYNVEPGAPQLASDKSSVGTFNPGDTVTFTVNVNKPVTGDNTAYLQLSNGGRAYLDGANSSPLKLIFKYVVPPNPVHSNDVTITSVSGITDAAGDVLNFANNPSGKTEIACFMPGTLIRTPDGERAIESLAIGDLVLTSAGDAKPILWIGRQTVSTVFADPLRVLPIRITADALDENLPVRDLLVSPDHALAIDGVLIQAGALVNDTTIRRENNVPTTFTYYHVELADHSLILAEGVPAETFVDNVDRMGFDNWDEHVALHPEGRPIAELELPRAKSHRQVPMATRARLARRAGELQPVAA